MGPLENMLQLCRRPVEALSKVLCLFYYVDPYEASIS